MHCTVRHLSANPGLLSFSHRSATPAPPGFTSDSHKVTSYVSKIYPGFEVSSKSAENHKNIPQKKRAEIKFALYEIFL